MNQQADNDTAYPSTEMVALLDAQFRYLYVAGAVVPLFGRQPAAMIGHDAFEYVHPEDATAVRQFMRSEAFRRQRRAAIVYRVRRADQRVVWFKTSIRIIDTKNARYHGEHVIVHRQISVQRAMTERLLGRYRRKSADPIAKDVLLDQEWARCLIDDAPMSVLLEDPYHFALLLADDRRPVNDRVRDLIDEPGAPSLGRGNVSRITPRLSRY